jgi:hypothetical protein
VFFLFQEEKNLYYMMSRAFAKKVQLKGRTRILTPPITWYRPINAITERINRIQ